MKFVCMLILASLVVFAAPLTCGPNLTTDGIAVFAGCPGNTYQVVVEPSTFFISFNDNPVSQGILPNGYTGDGDVNDAWVTGVIMTTSNPLLDEVTVTWGGALSGWTNEIFIGLTGTDAVSPGPNFVGNFAVDTDLPVTALAGNGDIYFGDSSLNPSGALYFYESQTVSTPEPGIMLLTALGLLWLGAWKFQRKENYDKR